MTTTEGPRTGLRLPHWGWFALATFVLVVAGVVLPVWLPYYHEHQIIQKIERMEGRVETEPIGPEWLREIVGNERVAPFYRVTEVYLSYSQITDEDLGQLSSLTELTLLHLKGTSVTDAGLAHLAKLSKLESLDLSATEVTDAGLVHVTGLTNLSYLYLSETKVTDAGNTRLAGMKQLRHLNVTKNLMSLEGIKTLQKALPSCNIYYSFGFPL